MDRKRAIAQRTGHLASVMIALTWALSWGVGAAQEKGAVSPYAQTVLDPVKHGLQTVTLNSAQQNVLSPGIAKLDKGVTPYVAHHMLLWANLGGGGEKTLDWKVNVPVAGEFSVSSLIDTKGCEFRMAVNDKDAFSKQIKGTG